MPIAMEKLLRMGTSLIVLQLLVSLSSSQAPSLDQVLHSNYTINPSFHPSFPYCKFSGKPTPYVTWSFNGNKLPSDVSNSGPYFISGSGVLVLTNALSGSYTCTAVNEFGSSSVSIEIIITSTPVAGWYLMPYMYFVYTLTVWGICSVLIMLLYCKKKRVGKSKQTQEDEDETYVNVHPVLNKVPPEWQPQLSTTEVFPVLKESSEWKKVVQKFKVTMPVSQVATILRIQNTWLWGKYSNQRKRMNTLHGNGVHEVELFFGTHGNNPKFIYESENGFDLRKKDKRLSGQANCFATDASYSDTYCYTTPDGYKEILMAKVLITDSGGNDPTLQGPSVSGVSISLQCDTAARETGSSQVFMTYDTNKAYPAYVIKYS